MNSKGLRDKEQEACFSPQLEVSAFGVPARTIAKTSVTNMLRDPDDWVMLIDGFGTDCLGKSEVSCPGSVQLGSHSGRRRTRA